jgi:hypothetical protein
MIKSQMSLSVRAVSLFAPAILAMCVSACAQQAIKQPAQTEPYPSLEGIQPGDRRILAGEWEYEEGGVVELMLDEQGNGLYGWKDGRIETVTLIGQIWQGVWFQKENDREGGFMVEFVPDFSEGNGTWWYTLIGSDHTPAQKGGTFRLMRRALSAKVSQASPVP